jgi:competence protein ComEC
MTTGRSVIRASALAFLAGILLVQQMTELPSLWWALLLIPFAAGAWWHRPFWLVPVFLVAGAMWVGLRAGAILDDSLAHALEGEDLVIRGHVADLPAETEFGWRFPFDVESATRAGRPVKIPGRILLSARGEEARPNTGSRWELAVRLTRPHGFQNPGGFDYEAYLFRHRIRARGYVREWVAPLPQPSARYGIDRVRERLDDRIRAGVAHSPLAGVVVALANGHARGVSPEQWDVLRATGTVHLVAISGLHISLIGGITFFLTRRLWSLSARALLWVPAPVAGAFGAVAAAAGYAALAGFVVPTQRALVMLAVVMGAIVARRQYLASEVLAMALLAVLVFDPLAVMAAGFWLSFAAVAVILLVVQGGESAWWRKLGYLQWAIGLGMLPLTLWLFQQVSLVGPVANLIAVPVFDLVVVPLVLLGIVTLPLPFEAPASTLFQLAAWLLEQLWPALEFLAGLSWSRWWQHAPAAWTLACALVGIGWLLAPRGWPARWVGAVWLLPLFLVRPPVPTAGEIWFTLLDVGQGLAAVVRTERHVLVYDAGPRFSASFDTGESVVVPYLRHAGVRRIDALVVSHGDNDHAGGVESVRRAMPVTRLVSSVPGYAASAEPCAEGRRWEWDGIRFELLNPPAGVVSGHNNASCVLRVSGVHGALLLPGDIEKKTEVRLAAQQRERLRAQVLVAPHHGSKTSSDTAFLAAVQPRYVLYPVGYRNRYRHPHPQVRERYAAIGAQALDSPALGAIEMRLAPEGIVWSGHRDRVRRYWFSR